MTPWFGIQKHGHIVYSGSLPVHWNHSHQSRKGSRLLQPREGPYNELGMPLGCRIRPHLPLRIPLRIRNETTPIHILKLRSQRYHRPIHICYTQFFLSSIPTVMVSYKSETVNRNLTNECESATM